MSSQAPAGWYPDPSGAPGHRWWDGGAWSASVSPAVSPATSPTMSPAMSPTMSPPASPVLTQPARGGSQLANRYALYTFGVVAIYLVLAFETRVVVFGILPLGLAFRSKQYREPLAPLAIGAAVLAIVVAAVRIFGH